MALDGGSQFERIAGDRTRWYIDAAFGDLPEREFPVSHPICLDAFRVTLVECV